MSNSNSSSQDDRNWTDHDRRALEAFAVKNPELEQLEDLLGQFMATDGIPEIGV